MNWTEIFNLYYFALNNDITRDCSENLYNKIFKIDRSF